MSWDLFVSNLPEGITSVAEIPDDFQPQPLRIPRADLTAAIVAIWPSVDTSDPARLVADSDSWSIEFSLGSVDPVDNFAMHVRGDRPPVPDIARLLDDLGLRAIDSQADSGLFALETAVISFGRWAEYRDRLT